LFTRRPAHGDRHYTRANLEALLVTSVEHPFARAEKVRRKRKGCPAAEALRYFILENGEAYLAAHFAHDDDQAASIVRP
jgi:hypothetical protein